MTTSIVIQNKAIKRYFNETSNDLAKAIEQIGELALYYSTHGKITVNPTVLYKGLTNI